jgi:hypothetical protein
LIGAITSQTNSNTYVITTPLTQTAANIPMITNSTTVDYNKSWILVLNMVGVKE